MSCVKSLSRAAFAAALLVSVSPFALGGAGMPGEHLVGAYAKDKGKSGQSHGKSANASSKSTATRGKPESPGKSQVRVAAVSAGDEVREQNIHARLAGLNSLGRNINGLMNSSDPRMDGVREYMGAYMQIPDAEAAFATADDAFHTMVSGLGLVSTDPAFDYNTASYDDLIGRLAALDAAINDPAADPALLPDLQTEYDALAAAMGTIDASPERADLATADAELMALQEATTDEALTGALMDAANRNRVAEYGDDYVTPEILDWAKNALGVAPEPEMLISDDPLVQ